MRFQKISHMKLRKITLQGANNPNTKVQLPPRENEQEGPKQKAKPIVIHHNSTKVTQCVGDSHKVVARKSG